MGRGHELGKYYVRAEGYNPIKTVPGVKPALPDVSLKAPVYTKGPLGKTYFRL